MMKEDDRLTAEVVTKKAPIPVSRLAFPFSALPYYKLSVYASKSVIKNRKLATT